MVVLILGAGRSGTSFYARSLSVMGAYFGPDVVTDNNSLNIYGGYENSLVKSIGKKLFNIIEPNRRGRRGLINKTYWKILSYRKHNKWHNYHTFFDDPAYRFPKDKSIKEIDAITRVAMERLLTDLNKGGVGVIKQPDMLYAFPFWRSMLDRLNIEYKIVAVFRNPVSVAKSRINQATKLKMPVMPEKGYVRRWTIKNRLLLEYTKEAAEAGVEVFWNNFDWPQEAMMQRLEANCERLGLKFDREKAAGLFDPSQKHYNDNVYDSVKRLGDPEVLKIYEELLKRSETVTA